MTRILIVDDNTRNRDILETLLSIDYTLQQAADGEEALRHLSEFRPDLILLDVMMPGMDGYETCRRIRKTEEFAGTKILMLSARVTEADRVKGYEAGADDYVTKPFNHDELLSKIRVFDRLRSVEEIDKLRRDILTLLGHEIRTPLTVVQGAGQLLHMAESKEEKDEAYQTLKEGVARLDRLARRVIELMELQNGECEEPSEIDLRETVEEVLRTTEQDRADRCIEVDCELEEQVAVAAAPGGVQRALEIILSNAYQHSSNGSRVAVRLNRCGDEGQVRIIDEAGGIPEEVRRYMMGGLVTNNLEQHGTGDGLSLAIAQQIMKNQGGRIEISPREASQSEFCITLPLAR